MATGILKVRGTEVVDSNGDAVVLRGAGLGGWMKSVNGEPTQGKSIIS